ncbi:MAG: Uma2 family endonuclease [Thermoanaerobaculia bacterium]|nr:Uma2 family endonuclease [Thermoanaerobaculia bacterium]
MTTIANSIYEIERNKPMPSLNHGVIQANLILHFAPFIKKYRIISELSLDLTNWPSVPDLAIYPKMKIDLQNDVVAMTEPPLCVVEIVSPTQAINELTAKAHTYFKHGVKSCWIVIPPLGNIYVYSSPEEYQIFRASDTLHDAVLNISFPLKEVFE